MATKNAQDLNINDVFYHNELSPWKVIEQPVLPVGVIIQVKAKHTKSGRIKTFSFGCMVSLDIPENTHPVS